MIYSCHINVQVKAGEVSLLSFDLLYFSHIEPTQVQNIIAITRSKKMNITWEKPLHLYGKFNGYDVCYFFFVNITVNVDSVCLCASARACA